MCDQKVSIEYISLCTTKLCYSAVTSELLYNKTLFTFEVFELLHYLVKDSFSVFRQIYIQIHMLHETNCVIWGKIFTLRFSFFIPNQETSKL